MKKMLTQHSRNKAGKQKHETEKKQLLLCGVFSSNSWTESLLQKQMFVFGLSNTLSHSDHFMMAFLI